ncbi:MAG: M23 family metallopeptidase, partial [Anaerolineaceae bacterium]
FGLEKTVKPDRVKVWRLAALSLLAGILLVSAAPTPPGSASEAEKQTLWQAYQQRYFQSLALNSSDPIAYLFEPVLDDAFITPDGKTAVLWLALRDYSGRILATEPGIVLASLSTEGWQVLLRGDPGWEEAFSQLPEGFLPAELQAAHAQAPNASPQTIWGYYLPYVKGTAHKLEGSVLHFHDYPPLGYPSCDEEYCHYAYDFTDTGHFPLVAARAGMVISSRDSCADGNTYCTNYIILQDVVGGAYQIYLHLAYGTVPNHLVPGVYVGRGTYIGDTDDTGYSTSEHVHFMVVQDFWWGGDGYPWGRSVDVRFTDVTINNGIPRTCYEVTHLPIYDGATECFGNKADPLNPNNDWFVSGNVGANPPTGQLTRPVAGVVVATGSNPLLDVTASTQDDVRVKTAVLQGLINGSWQEIGPRVSNPNTSGVFDWDVNLCQVGPLNGPLEVALKIWDHEGNEVSLLSRRTIQVDHACPPPVSQMTAPTTYDGTAFKLNWTAADSGAGIFSFQIQWRPGSEAWSTARQITYAAAARAAWFVGAPGGSYGFRMRAIDNNGQAETWPAGDAAEVTVTTPATCTEDAAEQDDTAATAIFISLGVEHQRNICGLGDSDWFKFWTGDHDRYMFFARSIGAGAAVRVSVYASDGTTLLGSATAPAVNSNTSLGVIVPENQVVYFKVEPAFTNLTGMDVLYGMKVVTGYGMSLPIILK